MSTQTKTPIGKTFLRQATGLVREIGFLDTFMFNLVWLNIGLGIGVTFSYAPALYPGGNIVVAMIIATVFSLVNVAVWGLMSAAIPRAGSPYVSVSRVLNPVIGFAINWAEVWFSAIIIVLGMSLFISDGLSPALASIGIMLGNDALIDAAFVIFEPGWQIVLGVGVIILFAFVMALGTRKYFSLQKVLFGLGVIAVLIAIFLLATSNNAVFIDRLEAAAGEGMYQLTLDNARAAGWEKGPASFYVLLGAIQIALFTLPWGYASAAIGAEVKEAHWTQPVSMLLAVLVGGIVITVGGALLIGVAGSEFLEAAGYLFLNDWENLPILGAPYFNFFASILTDNSIFIILIAVGFIAWTVMWAPINILTSSRYILAWSFDRILPEWFGEVSDRWHTPVRTIFFFSLVAIIFWLIWVLTGAFFLTSFTLSAYILVMVMSVAATLFPYRRKEMYEGSAISRYRLGKIPLITVLGVINILFFGVVFIHALFSPELGAVTPAAIITTIGLYASGFVVFYVAKSVRKSRDKIDITKVYEEIPPE